MDSALIDQQDFITALEADSYGHPKKAEARRLHIQLGREWVWTPKADRFGHVKELILRQSAESFQTQSSLKAASERSG